MLGRIAIILVLALAAIELGQLGINRVFDRVAQRARNPRRAAQIRTLGPAALRPRDHDRRRARGDDGAV